MRTSFAKVLFVHIPLLVLLLLQAAVVLVLYAGKISGQDNTMIDLGTHVPALRFGWPAIFVLALIYHIAMRRKKTESP